MDVVVASEEPGTRRAGVVGWLVAVPLTVAFLLAGLWLSAGVLAPGYYASFVFAAVWFVLAAFLLGKVRGRLTSLDRPIRCTYLATVAVLVVVFALTTLRNDTVEEKVAVAGSGNEQLAQGRFSGVAHDGSGTAAVVELPGGERRLTFTDLDTDNGPDLRVYLVAGEVTGDSDVTDFRDLGPLKGNQGTQQYDVPADLDIDRYSTVVIWCRAFSIAFAKAPLANV